MADWSSLPQDLVLSIADKFVAVEDYTAFTAVCRSFKGKRHWRVDVSRPPWLLLCCQDEDRCIDDPRPINERGFLSMYKNKKFYMNLPEIRGRRCWGSPQGWIVTLGLDLQLHLFNPLNRRRILLPQLTREINFDDENEKSLWMRSFSIDRAILIKTSLSSFRDYDNILVAATDIVGQLMVMRPHTNSWDTCLGDDNEVPGYIHDIISHNGDIYIVGNSGRILICSNIDSPDPPIAKEYVPVDEDTFEETDKLYLVESDGELLLVVRLLQYDDSREARYYNTYGIDVFKLDHQTKKWIRIEDLGDRALFIGGGCQSISLSPAEAFNCRRNSIYFTDDNFEQFRGQKGGQDSGIFDYEDGVFHTLYEGADLLSVYSTPTWFIPTFT